MNVKALCAQITTEQRAILADQYDIDKPRITRFAKGERVPSPAQVATICGVLDVDPVPYLIELSTLTATPKQRPMIARALSRLSETATKARKLLILQVKKRHYITRR